MNALSPVRIDILGLYMYEEVARLANRKYSMYKSAIASTNRIVDRLQLAGQCQHLGRVLFKINAEILVNQRGVQDRTGVLMNRDTDVSSENLSERMLAKAMGRPLLQKFHPDRGGDVQFFQEVQSAIRRGDVLYLRYLQNCHVDGRNLTWRCTDGIVHMRNVASVYESRLSRVRSHELSRIAGCYLAGNQEKAETRLAAFLRKRIAERHSELESLRRSK